MSVAYERYGPWTVADVLTLGEDRRYRHELLDGTLMVSAAPGIRHQRASRRLANVLDQAAHAAGAPVEVLEAIYVTVPSGLFIPDIAVVDRVTRGEPGRAGCRDGAWYQIRRGGAKLPPQRATQHHAP
ncbi:MAG TPA: Uma2 family endonuclease [Mycobacteriales bacterium]